MHEIKIRGRQFIAVTKGKPSHPQGLEKLVALKDSAGQVVWQLKNFKGRA